MPSSFFNDTAPTEIYTLSLHDALPISSHTNSTSECFTVAAPTPTPTNTPTNTPRSEEHTSELQSQSNLVCRLLFLMIRPPPRSTLFPSTTLFRSRATRTAPASASRLPRRRRRPRIRRRTRRDRKSTRLNSSHSQISYAVFFF